MAIANKLTKEDRRRLRKEHWKMWKNAPWVSWFCEKQKDLNDTEEFFLKLPRHIVFGKWREKAMFPVYKGNLAKLLDVDVVDVTWKDKYDTPRYEYAPRIQITLFWGLVFLVWWGYADKDYKMWDNDRYWEQFLWTKYYSHNDIEKAKETWPWRDRNGNSTWDDRYLKPEYRNL